MSAGPKAGSKRFTTRIHADSIGMLATEKGTILDSLGG